MNSKNMKDCTQCREQHRHEGAEEEGEGGCPIKSADTIRLRLSTKSDFCTLASLSRQYSA